MAKAAQQFRASDVTIWGLVTLGTWTLAVLGANLSALVPDSIYSAFHASRLDGSTINQLRVQVAALDVEAARLKRENSQLAQRFMAAEQLSGDTTRRVGALEISLPKLVEAGAFISAALGRTTSSRVARAMAGCTPAAAV